MEKIAVLNDTGIFNLTGLCRKAGLKPSSLHQKLLRKRELREREIVALQKTLNETFQNIGYTLKESDQ